jgi:hypothetical protein
MMQRSVFLLCLLLILPSFGWCQHASIPETVPKESIAVHLNTTFFLTGETLLFNIYCTNSANGKLSDLSRIAYVELVGEDMKPLAQIKVVLENGVGRGDYFFDGKTPSGNYTLVAYTKWMRNFDSSSFFRKTLSVINSQMATPVSNSSSPMRDNEEATSNQSTAISAQLSKTTFKPREKVAIQIEASSNADLIVSVNVRVEEPGLRLATLSTQKGETDNARPIRFLPDVRSELMTGTIKYRSDGRPLVQSLVTLSAPSKHFQFLTSRTDSSGHFYFNSAGIESDEILIHVFNAHNDDFIIQNDNPFLGDYAGFAPPKLAVDTAMRQLINRRYLSVQVENAFYSLKRDSTLGTTRYRRFFSPNKVYELDNFTRFPTMEDVFREIIPEVVVRAREGDFSFVMFNGETGYRFTNPPLVLLDGIPVNDANELIQYDPNLIKTISLATHHYFYGGLETDGIISIETFEGAAKNISLTHMSRLNYIRPQPPRIYYSPDYDAQDLKRIPDYRTQLYWSPGITISKVNPKTITFFTGDSVGKYFVEITGVTSEGKPVYWKQRFEVR